ncbi:endonuclease/exonuclease/phosphatase family protein [Yeosuana marina]|uniref:endonuclease/exonuclease/phosphatase family protein n=1 Tax=Yeosuana marina TaxID=1565536 RepID=UPI0030EF9D02
MKLLKCIMVLLLLSSLSPIKAQAKKTYKIHTVAFYNLENLFDTINDPTKFDESSPIMELKTNRSKVYKEKIHNMAKVIADIGFTDTHNTPALIGVSEVENREVLETLINDSLLYKKDYGIIQYPSPDIRGIDVALLYQKNLFIPISSSSHELKIYDDNRKRVFTRDQLLVSGQLDGDLIHIIVNHWPSRRGGINSNPKRIAAAKLTKHMVDSLQIIDPYAKVFIMGDLNDDPTSPSVKDVLKTKRKKTKVRFKGLYNPYENFYRNGLGTTAYRDSWSLFDQIMMTEPWVDKDFSTYKFFKAGIFNASYLTQKSGQYKGYPYRSWGYEGFTGGYSDHFPVYVYVIKEIK